MGKEATGRGPHRHKAQRQTGGGIFALGPGPLNLRVLPFKEDCPGSVRVLRAPRQGGGRRRETDAEGELRPGYKGCVSFPEEERGLYPTHQPHQRQDASRAGDWPGETSLLNDGVSVEMEWRRASRDQDSLEGSVGW